MVICALIQSNERLKQLGAVATVSLLGQQNLLGCVQLSFASINALRTSRGGTRCVCDAAADLCFWSFFRLTSF
jgi:hypothetical protein